MRTLFFTIIIHCLLIQIAAAQQKDEETDKANEADFTYFRESNLFQRIPVDTSLNNFHIYNPVFGANPFTAGRNFGYVHPGNPGTPYYSLTYQPDITFGFDFGKHTLDAFRFTGSDIHYMNSPTPRTDINYVIGGKKQQYLNVLHTQGLAPILKFGFDYRRVSSPGFYTHQKTDHTNLWSYAWLHSKNRQYNLLLNVIMNNLALEENGGIVSMEELDTVPRREAVNVHLLQAERFVKDRIYKLTQTFDLGPKREIQVNDSVSFKKIMPSVRVFHSIAWQQKGDRFTDIPDPFAGAPFYPNIFYDSTATSDSISHRNLENQLGLQFYNYPGRQISDTFKYRHVWEAKVRHSMNNILYHVQQAPDTSKEDNEKYIINSRSANNLNLLLNFYKETIAPDSGLFDYNAGIKYSFIDYNAGDYDVSANLSYRPKAASPHRFMLRIADKQYAPALFRQFNISNYFKWENDFDKTHLSQFGLSYAHSRLGIKVSADAYSVNRPVYYNTNAVPAQLNGRINIFQGTLIHHFNWRKWHLENLFVYQTISGNDVLHLPDLWGRHSLYFTPLLFKFVETQVGLNVRYIAPYFANSYMPATGQFYLQNTIKTEFHPVVDAFINFKIKRARFFVRVNHINGFINGSYYDVPVYPMPDFSYNVGVSWKMYY